MISAELLSQAGIDYEAGMKRFMSDADLYEAVLISFLGEDVLERAEAAYTAKDYKQLFDAVHEARVSGGKAGLDKLYAVASILVKLLRSKSFTEHELKLEYECFYKGIRHRKGRHQSGIGKVDFQLPKHSHGIIRSLYDTYTGV